MRLALLMYRTISAKGRSAPPIADSLRDRDRGRRVRLAVRLDAGTGYLSALFNNSAPLTSQSKALAVIIVAEIWKTTPFMALLLMAGPVPGPEDLLKAGKVDGATAWQRFTKITLPLMKPAILVALLFRSLDSFRIFDNIFILTSGTNSTGSVSILGYDNLFTGLNLGRVGDVDPDFICVAIIAFCSTGFGASAPGGDPETGDPVMACNDDLRQKVGWGIANFVTIALALIPVLWLVSLSFKTPLRS